MTASRPTLAFAMALGLAAPVAQAAPPPAYKACAACHLANGKGVPGAFPPLAGRVAPIAATPGGRRYLVDVMAIGLSGQITVGSTVYRGFMPRQVLSAADAAAVLNYLGTEAGDPKTAAKFKPFTAAEVEQLRKASAGRTPADIAKTRLAVVPDAGRR
ncbi:MAG: cytochrome c [Pseudomonadota bacterium]